MYQDTEEFRILPSNFRILFWILVNTHVNTHVMKHLYKIDSTCYSLLYTPSCMAELLLYLNSQEVTSKVRPLNCIAAAYVLLCIE